jgi:hypothetical protein
MNFKFEEMYFYMKRKYFAYTDLRELLDPYSEEYRTFEDDKKLLRVIKLCETDFPFEYLVHGYKDYMDNIGCSIRYKYIHMALWHLLDLVKKEYIIEESDYYPFERIKFFEDTFKNEQFTLEEFIESVLRTSNPITKVGDHMEYLLAIIIQEVVLFSRKK